MSLVIRIAAADELRDRWISDTLILDHAQRRAQRFITTGSKGTPVEIAFEEPVRLRTDDRLLLEDGSLVEVVAAAEKLLEARAADLDALSRLAWHLGDRHIAVEILPNRVRALYDPAVETLLRSLGAKVSVIEAPFEPEGGAYAVASHHGEPAHVHDEHCSHDHSHDHAHGRHHHHR